MSVAAESSESTAPSAPSEANEKGPALKERLLRWSPAIVGLVLAGVGLAAAAVAASQVTITVAHPEPISQEADPVALLRDDVAALQGQLTGIREGTGKGIQALGRHLDAVGDERQDELLDAHTALSKRVARVERALGASQRQLSELAARPAVTSARPGATGPSPSAAKPTPTKPPAQVAKVEPAPEPVVPRKRKKRRSLFGFKLAAGGPDFGRRTRYVVIGSLSRVGFDAKSTLHDFSGATTDVKGRVELRLDDQPEAHGEISAGVVSLKTGVEGRDEEMRKVMDAKAHPRIRFKLETLVAQASDAKQRTFKGQVSGTFSIHGVDRAVLVPVTITVDRSQRLQVKGEAKIKMSEFKLEVPSVAGAIKVEDTLKLWLSLRLRSLGRAQGSSK